MKGPLKS